MVLFLLNSLGPYSTMLMIYYDPMAMSLLCPTLIQIPALCLFPRGEPA